MNMRIETGPFSGAPTQPGVLPVKEVIESGPYGKNDMTTEEQLIQDALNNPEQIPQPTTRPSRKSQDEIMKEALARFKAEQAAIEEKNKPQKQEQMSQDWSEFEEGNKIRLEKKAERAEKRSLSSSTSNLATGSRMSATELSGESLKQKEQEIAKAWQAKEAHPLLEQQLLRTQEALQEAHQEGDKELVAILEEQEKNLQNAVNKYRETAPSPTLSEDQREIGLRNIETQKRYAENKKFSIPESMITDTDFIEIPNTPTPASLIQRTENKTSLQDLGPDDRTLDKLHQLGISYEELVGAIPDFAGMSEGQRAYILYKAEQQSIEHIQEKADTDFKDKRANSGFFKKLFGSGAMRREANRDAANAHVGLDAFRDDIANMTRHVKDGRWDIVIEEEGNYRIEYAKAPSGIDEDSKALFDDFNRAGTVLSDVPYEWGLPTASKKEQQAFKEAHKNFELYEKRLQSTLKENGALDENILSDFHAIKSEVEHNQFFSSYPKVSSQIDSMKNATFSSDFVKKIFNPSAAGIAAGSSARLVSKSLWGLGGATGASAIIGGIMAWRRKNTEFKTDAKTARRGGETKKTTDSLFDSKKNADRIYKLLSQLENQTDPKRRESTLVALEDRLQLLDERLKSGRVNFGKAQEQLVNKNELMKALSAAHMYRYELSQESQDVSGRVAEYFEKQDRQTKGVRQKERVKAVAIGSLIGAGSAATAWMIADYFKGGETSAKVLEALRDGAKGAGSFAGGVGASIQDGFENAGDYLKDKIIPDGQPWFPHGTGGVGAENIIDGGSGSPTDFEVSVDASSKGAIATFADLQEQLKLKYPDISQAPKHIQEFMGKTPTELAIEENMYRPNDPSGNESAKIFKGGKLGFNEKGELFYTDGRSGMSNLSGDGKFGGEHFDYKGYQESKFAPQEFSNEATNSGNGAGTNSDKLHSGTPWETEKKPWMEGVNENGVRISDRPMYPGESQADNIFAGNGGTSPAETVSSSGAEQVGVPEGVERVKLSNKLSVDFEMIEDAKGRPQTRFLNVNLDNFNAYHKAYLQKDLASYAREIAGASSFLEENPGMTASDVEKDLRNLTNQMIMRDQVLQEGGLDPKSDEYKILRKERDAIQKVIKNNFEWYTEESLFSRNVFDGNKYPDPNYVFEGMENNVPSTAEEASFPNVESEASVSKPASSEDVFPRQEANTETVAETVPKQEGTVEITTKNTEAIKDIKFSVTRNSEGVITEMKAIAGSIDPSKVSLEKFGYNPNWLSLPEFAQTFKDTGPGKKLLGDIDIIKSYVALRDSFSPNTDEYNFLNNAITKRIDLVESKYPSIFN